MGGRRDEETERRRDGVAGAHLVFSSLRLSVSSSLNNGICWSVSSSPSQRAIRRLRSEGVGLGQELNDAAGDAAAAMEVVDAVEAALRAGGDEAVGVLAFQALEHPQPKPHRRSAEAVFFSPLPVLRERARVRAGLRRGPHPNPLP
jgi:hypothetical protein